MVTKAKLQVLAALTEAEWQEWVENLATLRDWKHYHTHNSRRSDEGFPDLVLARGSKLIVAELKKEGGKVSEAQREWLQAFALTGVDAYTWWPHDIEEVEEVLR